MQLSEASTGQAEDTRAQKQPEDPEDRTDSNGQPNGELVRADTIKEEQNSTDHSETRLDGTNNGDQPKIQTTDDEVESGKPEEKVNDDHGGEELVEGQEDDVIY